MGRRRGRFFNQLVATSCLSDADAASVLPPAPAPAPAAFPPPRLFLSLLPFSSAFVDWLAGRRSLGVPYLRGENVVASLDVRAVRLRCSII